MPIGINPLQYLSMPETNRPVYNRSPLGGALLGIGQQLPKLMADRRQEARNIEAHELDKKQKEAELKITNYAQGELERTTAADTERTAQIDEATDNFQRVFGEKVQKYIDAPDKYTRGELAGAALQAFAPYADDERAQEMIKRAAEYEKLIAGDRVANPYKSEIATQMLRDINAMPEGPEKDAALDDMLMGGYISRAAFDATKAGMRRKIDAKVNEQYALIPGKVATAAATKEADEMAKRKVQKAFPMLTSEGSGKIAQSAEAITHIRGLVKELEKGNIDFFDLTGAGAYKNAKVHNAFKQVLEIIAREQSGAAINQEEWETFKQETLNKRYMMSPEGRAVALENLIEKMNRFVAVGQGMSLGDDWYTTLRGKSMAATKKILKTQDTPAADSADTSTKSQWKTVKLSNGKTIRMSVQPKGK